MTTERTQDRSQARPLPDRWRADAESRLQPGERLLAALEPDLDAHLRFADGLVLLTDRRLLARAPGETTIGANGPSTADANSTSATTPASAISNCSTAGRASRSGASRSAAIRRRSACCSAGRRPESRSPPDAASTCGRCGNATLPPDSEAECPRCEQEADRPPSTRTLFRLWRFARPYRGRLFCGLPADARLDRRDAGPALPDHAADGRRADPVPERRADRRRARRLLLAACSAPSLLAWGLGWARPTSWRWVSERIGADLRTTTYEHLLQLSLEYFGGKRTGDLMARIGSETDRICVFLSLHALDFAPTC
jgi:ATP-binding cassette subfamily B protein